MGILTVSGQVILNAWQTKTISFRIPKNPIATSFLLATTSSHVY